MRQIGRVRKSVALNDTDLGQDILVEVRLECRHLHPENPLTLGRQRCKNITFQSAQHQGLKLFVEFLDLLLVVGICQVELIRQLDCEGRAKKSVLEA